MTMKCGLSILVARSGFIRGHCGKVATKAPSGRETGASAQAAIHLQLRAVLSSLSYLNIGQCQHGLRHAYAQDRYEELAGWSCPAAGGPVAKDLTPEQREIDSQVRLTISRELGHERAAVVGAYLGR
ncbi:MAG: hypothetical protein WBN48_16450 [Thiogranum sp.]